MRRLFPLALALLVLVGAPAAHTAGPQMAFGAAEDIVRQDDPVVARQKMAQLAAAGMRAVRVTSMWVPPATAPTGRRDRDADERRDRRAALRRHGVRLRSSAPARRRRR